ncbi:MAG: hypothetical protein QW286_01535, partial [Candidatus Aenigmatarchaeota archaeon]
MTIKNLIDYLDDYGLKGNKNIYYFYARFLKPGFVLKKGFSVEGVIKTRPAKHPLVAASHAARF